MEHKFKCAVFDLDGTLVNTIDDLAGACQILIEKYHFKAQWTVDDYKEFVGNGARKLVERAFAHTLSETDLDRRYAEFKDIYQAVKMDHAYAYEGIKEQLALLKQNGIRLAVVTNKPDAAAKEMVEALFGKDYFDIVIGARDGVPTKPDPRTVNEALSVLGCRSEETVYFGDSDIDIITARNAHIKSVGVTWGYRSAENLSAQSPWRMIASPQEITKLF